MIFRKKVIRNSFILLSVALTLAITTTASAQSVHQAIPRYIPQRVYDSNEKRFIDFESMLVELSRADVVFVGEQHDDAATHRLERAILEGLARRRGNVLVAMEMFERDVQQSLDDYFAGRLSEEDFLKTSRPWPRYASDYRSLVEFARFQSWRVIASNVPRRYASQVSKQGLAAVDVVPASERKFIASQIQCPFDDYFKRFSEAMNSHPVADGDGKEPEKMQNDEHRAMIERFYYAQCIKDETMAESITEQLQLSDKSQQRPLIVHFNGTFHSDYRLGAAARVNRRLPKSKIKVVTVVPLDDLDTIKAEEYRKRGDYIVFSLTTELITPPTRIATPIR
ncbi:MAG: ChaN family lipoprotein [Acidobacteria bacterium]|nr:ChaN family lipoprotein [Acidobacteriota bacterium]